MSLVGAVLGLLPLLRFWRVRRALLAPLAPDETYTVAVGPAGLTVSTAQRVLLIRWPGVTGVFVTRREVVITMASADVVSAPMDAFHGDGHLVGFVQAIRAGTIPAA